MAWPEKSGTPGPATALLHSLPPAPGVPAVRPREVLQVVPLPPRSRPGPEESGGVAPHGGSAHGWKRAGRAPGGAAPGSRRRRGAEALARSLAGARPQPRLQAARAAGERGGERARRRSPGAGAGSAGCGLRAPRPAPCAPTPLLPTAPERPEGLGGSGKDARRSGRVGASGVRDAGLARPRAPRSGHLSVGCDSGCRGVGTSCSPLPPPRSPKERGREGWGAGA